MTKKASIQRRSSAGSRGFTWGAAWLLLCSALLCGDGRAVPAREPQAGVTRREREMSAAEAEKALLPPATGWVPVRVSVPRELNGLAFRPPPQVRDWQFFGRRTDRSRWFLVCQDPDGQVAFACEREAVELDPKAMRVEPDPGLRWTFFRSGMTLDFGGQLLLDLPDLESWELFWVNLGQAAPETEKLYPADLEDGFMRTTFAVDDRWTRHSGTWSLRQYGGGMPRTDKEAQDANYRRAANAFTLVGSDGEVSHGRDSWTNLYAEARFFFGRPGTYATQDTLTGTTLGGEPTYADPKAIYRSNQVHEYPETDLFLALGAQKGFRLAFGWCAERCRFQLRRCDPGETQWRVLREWNMRPYCGNWVRIGLGLSRGCRAMPFLDGDQLGTYLQDCVVHGPVGIMAGPDGKIEADDVMAWSYPEPPTLGAPVFEPSANFAQKELLPAKDRQTGQWTRSQLSFEEDEAKVRGRAMFLKRCQFPFYGDFTYCTSPAVPEGDYLVALVNEQERPYYQAFFARTRDGWSVPGGRPEFSLEVGRRKGQVVRQLNGEWELLCNRQVPGTVWLVLGAASEAALDPENHLIYSRCLSHDLFEHAPTDWAWREGNFRMDVRWQCQRGWNFMMGKSRDLAVMYGKTEYQGDQEIEFYVALRFCTPPPDYYIVRDMGFAFCTDGKSLASGYALIYGDEDNTRTTLLREGVPVQQVPVVIKPKDNDGNIHNYWWHGKVSKRGKVVTVQIDDQTVISFTDNKPLRGGHVAFWTLRNAISLAKVSVNAERAIPRPELFRLPADPPPTGRWRALNPDETEVKRSASGRLEVVNRVGGGTLAVRHVPPAPGVDLRETPWLNLPLKCERDTRVAVHLQVGGRSFLYPLSAPTKGMRCLLTPAQEEATPEEIYRQPCLTESDLKQVLVTGRHSASEVVLDLRGLARSLRSPLVESITIGNSSNHEYLLLGAGGNGPGSGYLVGDPQWRR